MAGSSDRSEPEGYMIYSAPSIEPSVCRKLSEIFSVEMNVRTESREVDFTNPLLPDDIPLGSVELLPVTVLLKAYLPSKRVFHPYAGAGMNVTFCWEKSSALNSLDLTPSFGHAIQLGMDIAVSTVIFLNFHTGWNLLRTNLKVQGNKIATFTLDPVSLGAGLGFRF